MPIPAGVYSPRTQDRGDTTMALRPKTKTAAEPTLEPEAVEQTAATAGATSDSGNSSNTGNSGRPMLRWNANRDKALLALIAANTERGEDGTVRCTLTREQAAEQLAKHDEFKDVSDLVTPQKVGLRAGQLRRPVERKGGGLAGLPRFRSIGGGGGNRTFYSPATVADELQSEFSQFATAPAASDDQPAVAS